MDSPPECINTEEKQKAQAYRLAVSIWGQKVASVKPTSAQGLASITLEVLMEDASSRIIQFRKEPLDLTLSITARRLLGSYVPEIQAIEDLILSNEKVFAYHMNKMTGKTWCEAEDYWEPGTLVESAASLGRVLSMCFVPRGEWEDIENYIQSELKKILTMPTRSDVDVRPYFPLVEELIEACPKFCVLPSFFTHLDLNPLNIFMDDAGHLHGLIDWEETRMLPFGINCWGIHHFAGQFLTVESGEIEWVERPNYEAMERAFWEALIDNAAPDAREVLSENIHLVQLAVITGTILRVLGIYIVDGEEVTDLHLPSLRFLPKLLTYRVPLLRGAGECPFREQPASWSLDLLFLP